MLRATFAGFSVARGALSASQKALDVTGQNISNVYTEGYTRQRLDQVSLTLGYGNYASSQYVAQIGNGVLVTGVSQIRDPYLDIQYRDQMANVGASDAKASVLEQIESVFDETMKSAVKDAFSDLESKLLDLANSTGSELDDSLVRESMKSLVSLFHFNTRSLSSKRDQITEDFEKNSIRQANELLRDIAKLNETIKNSHVLGYPALEVQDERNLLLDELASYVPIEIVRTDEILSRTPRLDAKGNPVKDSAGNVLYEKLETVENIRVNIVMHDEDGNVEKFALIDNDQYGSFTSKTDGKITTVSVNSLKYDGGDPEKLVVTNGIAETDSQVISEKNGNEIIMNIDGGTFKGMLDMLNSSGAFDTENDTPTENGLGYYEKAFDLMIDTFAKAMNELNGVNENGNPAPLFDTSDGSTDFTAANIKLTDDWISGATKLKTKIDSTPDGSTQNDNINKFIAALKEERTFKPDPNDPNSPEIYKGDFYNFYVYAIESPLGIDQQATKNLLDNHIAVSNTISQSRDQVSGVSLDEEGVNMMQYQQSFTAAARLMTALDEVLTTLINNTGVAGR